MSDNMKINVPKLLEELDLIYASENLVEAEELLESSLEKARNMGDWSSELSILSEMMGFYRRNNKADKGLCSVYDGLDLIKAHGLEGSVSGATVMLNAATTQKAFGDAEKAVEIYEKVKKIYGRELDENDPRNAALFNNFATTLVDLERFEEAEKLYLRAIALTEKATESLLDCAVSYVNMAHLYEKWQGGECERIEDCLARAEALIGDERIKRDAYYAFVCEKCAPAFDYFGFFLLAEELRRISREIYEGA